MKPKTLVLALSLVGLAVVASTTYVLAHRGPSTSYYGTTSDVAQFQDEEWWREMRTYMEQKWEDHEDDEWWDEMSEHMEEHWEELEDGYYRYGRSSRYGGCHW